jgi:group II intron reverse transcriptase/maturase
MRNPEFVLNSLAAKAHDENYKFERLYRNLYNEAFYQKACRKLIPGENVRVERLLSVASLIEQLKTQKYRPQPSGRIPVSGAAGSTFEDQLVQEVVRSLLTAIYEGSFSNDSHGFRPGRSCHTALDQIRHSFTGVVWFIEGDLKPFFNKMDHHTLIKIMRRRIDDEKFISLIWKFLKAGYMEDWNDHLTYSGTPTGGILSPILSNIYLDELDKFVGCLKEGRSRDKTGLKLVYVRYAGDFLIGVIGSKKEAKEIRDKLRRFLAENLKLELPEENMRILYSAKPAKFLGYEIMVNRNHHPHHAGKCKLQIPAEQWKRKLLKLGALRIDRDGTWKIMHRSGIAYLDDVKILNIYNDEIIGYYRYYQLADNVSVLNKFYHVMKGSLYKTFANKYRSTVRKMIKRFHKDGVFTVTYQTEKGRCEKTLYHGGFKRLGTVIQDANVDMLPKMVNDRNKCHDG